jgi:hypothetical protein
MRPERPLRRTARPRLRAGGGGSTLKALTAFGIVVTGTVAALAIYTFGRPEGQNHAKQPMTTTPAARTVLRLDSRRARFGPTYARVTEKEALQRARELVISSEYRDDEPLFYRNTGDAAVIQRSTIGGHKAWRVRFEDGQVPKLSCVAVRGGAGGVVAATQVACARK